MMRVSKAVLLTANVGLVLGEIDDSWDCISGSSMVPGTMLKLQYGSNIKLLSKLLSTLLLKNSTIVEVLKSHLAPQRIVDLLVVCLTTRNPRDYINKAGGECGNQTCHLGR